MIGKGRPGLLRDLEGCAWTQWGYMKEVPLTKFVSYIHKITLEKWFANILVCFPLYSLKLLIIATFTLGCSFSNIYSLKNENWEF